MSMRLSLARLHNALLLTVYIENRIFFHLPNINLDAPLYGGQRTPSGDGPPFCLVGGKVFLLFAPEHTGQAGL